MSIEFERGIKVLPNPDRPSPPEVIKQLVRLRVSYIGFDGNTHSGIIEVNELVAEDVNAFFEKAVALEFPIENVLPAGDAPYHWDDELLMADNITSGFNNRPIPDTTRPSFHSTGLAFDVNTRLNLYIRFIDGTEIIAPEGASWQPHIPGTLTVDHPLVQLMLERGWEWGGNWTKDSGRIDYQHFQKSMAS